MAFIYVLTVVFKMLFILVGRPYWTKTHFQKIKLLLV